MIIAVTGSFSSGKSSVSNFLIQRGAIGFNADTVAHQGMEPGQECYGPIIQLFGHSIIGEDHRIDRRRLGRKVFSDTKKLQALCRIIHPYVRRKFKEETERILKSNSQGVIVLEVPLLIESGMDREVDVVVVATTTLKKQTERAIKRFGLAEWEVSRRIKQQLPLKEKAKRADFVISTSGSFDETEEQVKKLCQHLKLSLL